MAQPFRCGPLAAYNERVGVRSLRLCGRTKLAAAVALQ